MKAMLLIPSEEWTDQLDDLRNELIETGENMDGSSHLLRYDDISEWLEYIKLMSGRDTVPAGIVPMTQFIYVREEDRKIVGVIQLRHYLDRSMELYFGHIGYGVRPSERRKGYATAMLRDLLPECRKLGLDRVMICCEKCNEGSRRTILNNGGVYDSTIYMTARDIYIERYWIDL